ncbi:MAG TPA: RDD family protein [Thermoanaerobaculia bacterium]
MEIQGRPYCAGCKTEQVLDYRSGVDRTVLHYAGIGRRFVAIFLDNLIIMVPLMIVMFAILFSMRESISEENAGLFNLMFLPLIVVAPIYEGLMLQITKGQTIGKKLMGIRVVNADGAPISTGQAWGRTGMRTVFGFLSCLGLIDYIMAFFNPEKTTIHDMVATTRVVYA